jgi:hypothetical protein
MTEAEWLACADPQKMLGFLSDVRGETRRKGGRRKFRLFACACLRGIWPLLRDPGSRTALYVAEKAADGTVSSEELAQAHSRARSALANEAPVFGSSPYWQSAEAAVQVSAPRFGGGDYASVSHSAGSAALAWALGQARAGEAGQLDARLWAEHKARQAAQGALLRDVFGNPFHPLVVDSSWRTPPVVALAEAAYQERPTPTGELDPLRLAVLADALEEVGADENVVTHLRSAGPHVRGCFVIDRLTGRE